MPLEKNPPYPTYHLANEHFFNEIKPGTVLINSSRGSVVETSALLKAIEQKNYFTLHYRCLGKRTHYKHRPSQKSNDRDTSYRRLFF